MNSALIIPVTSWSPVARERNNESISSIKICGVARKVRSATFPVIRCSTSIKVAYDGGL